MHKCTFRYFENLNLISSIVYWRQLFVHNKLLLSSPGLETYFFSNLQAFVSGFNLNLQIVVSYSQFSFAIISEIDSLNHA